MSAGEGAIVLEGLTKDYGPLRAVDGLSLEVRRGECYGLIGANGAGKTTTFSLLCGYLKPTSGRVTVLGVDPRSPGALKGRLGVLPQDAVLPPTWKVGTLLTYWGRLSGLTASTAETEARRLLERVGLPQSWSSQAGALSHGMAKRVSLAQALLGNPPVVLLDEPTAGLDPRIAAEIRQLVRELKGQHTLVISSHNLQELEELCDSAAILDRGKRVSAGPMHELTGKSGELRIRIARGAVPVEALRAMSGCTGVSLSPEGLLRMTYDTTSGAPEEVITRVLGVLLGAGVLVLSVSPGHSLEERVLQVT